MVKTVLLALTVALSSCSASPAFAHGRHHRHSHHHAERHATPIDGAMAVIHAASGATAIVAREAAGKFQALVNGLEAAGARIKFMGGLSHRRIAGTGTWSKHSVGHAIDVCQYGRNEVDRGCRLPPNATAIAERVGLTHGAVWGHPDTGHFEVPGPNPGSSGRAYASRRHGGTRYASYEAPHRGFDRAAGVW